MSWALRAVGSRTFVVGAFALALVAVAPGAVARGAARSSGQLSPGAERLRAQGYLARDQAAYEAAKATAAAAAGQDAGNARGSSGPKASSVTKGWAGVADPNVSPSDSTGAVGTTRYIETINDMYGIYDRTGGTLATGTLAELTNDANTCCGGFSTLTDPQVVWDPATSRFYYVVLDFLNSHLEYGFSKTDSPSTGTNAGNEWCKYDLNFSYGTNIPDYPKMGTTADFVLFGVNDYTSASTYVGSDIDWIKKPQGAGAISSCPAAPTTNRVQNVLNAGGASPAFTPVPAIQTDSSNTGWVVSVTDLLTDTRLTLFQVTKDGSGNAVIPTTGTTVTVASYSAPPNAPAGSGSGNTLDTLDNRLTQAILAFDPSEGATAIWTQHAIAGGAGSKVRWYELKPSTAAVLRTGDVSDGSLYVFNGAVSPDRVVNGANTAFGSNMATIFTTSSSSTFPSIQAVTKTAWDAQSGFISLKAGTAAENDFTCTPCRWGDYAAATPDPAADRSGSQGSVWFTNMFSVSGSDANDVDWRTWNGALQLGESYGYLRVVTSPAVASTIFVDGNIMDSWGLTWVKVPIGTHSVSWSYADGYTTPAAQPSVVVTEGATTTVTGTFVPRGLQRVITSPAEPGTISVDGIPRNDWGMWTWLPTGSHQICFGSVADFDPPSCQMISVAAGTGNTDVTGTYVSNPGAAGSPNGVLRVVTSPAVPSQILLNGTPADSWGTWGRLPAGGYTVSFTDVNGYTTPAPQMITVANGTNSLVTGTFVQQGLLHVVTSPAVPSTIYVDGIPRNDWGVWTWYPTGSHTICFGWAAGYNQPVCQTISLTTAGATVTGTFTVVS